MAEPTTYDCGVEIRPARFYEDPEPAEFCENQVTEEGEPCTAHGGEDEPDWDAIRKDAKIDRDN